MKDKPTTNRCFRCGKNIGKIKRSGNICGRCSKHEFNPDIMPRHSKKNR